MKEKIIKAKDPGSSVTHFIGMLMAIFSSIPLLLRAAKNPGYVHIISLTIFIISMILLYFASTIYHTLNISEKINLRLKKFDHMMIYVLIAGTYTPICTIALNGNIAIGLLVLIWGLAIGGIIVTGFWVNSPKWLSSVVYIAMGWIIVFFGRTVKTEIPPASWFFLLAGGAAYTGGAVVYAMKKVRWTHPLWHLFVLAGTLFHFFSIWNLV